MLRRLLSLTTQTRTAQSLPQIFLSSTGSSLPSLSSWLVLFSVWSCSVWLNVVKNYKTVTREWLNFFSHDCTNETFILSWNIFNNYTTLPFTRQRRGETRIDRRRDQEGEPIHPLQLPPGAEVLVKRSDDRHVQRHYLPSEVSLRAVSTIRKRIFSSHRASTAGFTWSIFLRNLLYSLNVL